MWPRSDHRAAIVRGTARQPPEFLEARTTLSYADGRDSVPADRCHLGRAFHVRLCPAGRYGSEGVDTRGSEWQCSDTATARAPARGLLEDARLRWPLRCGGATAGAFACERGEETFAMRIAHRATVALVAGVLVTGPAVLGASVRPALAAKPCCAKRVKCCCGSAGVCSCRRAPENRREAPQPVSSPWQSDDERHAIERSASASFWLPAPPLARSKLLSLRSASNALIQVCEQVVLRC